MPEIQTQPYNKSLAWTASNSVNFPTNLKNGLCDAVSVSGAGNLAAVYQDDTVAIIPMAAGQLLPLRLKRINSTSTTATGLAIHYVI